jgi:uncharacterized membrane protein
MIRDTPPRITFGARRRVTIALTLALAIAFAALEAIVTWPVPTVPLSTYFEVGHAVVGAAASLVVPGYLLLLIVGVRGLRPSKMLVYSVGVSCAFLLVTGLAVVSVAGVVGLEPFATIPWVLAGSLVALAGLLYARPNGTPVSHLTTALSLRDVLAVVQLALLPLLAVVAASVVNGGGGTLPTLLLIALVAGVVVQVAAGVIPASLRPFAVWSVALAVLLQMTLISPHIWGWDIHYQYADAHAILQNGGWTPADSSLLSVTLLAAVYTATTGLELAWVYKLLYPLVASLLPVAVYHLATLTFDDERIAALAPFVLVFYYGFFKIMPDKQLVSLFFLALVLVAMLDDSLGGIQKRGLMGVFGALLIVSHYGTSLLFIGLLAATVVIIALAHRADVVEAVDGNVVRPTYLLFLGTGWTGWYLYTDGGTNFERVARTASRTLSGVALATLERTGAGYATETFDSQLWVVNQLLHVGLIALIAAGVVWALSAQFRRRTEAPRIEYTAFASFMLFFLATGVVLTYSLGFDRILLIALVPLAPFAVYGLGGPFATNAAEGQYEFVSVWATVVLTGLLVVFFVFSSGAAFAVAGEEVPDYSINLDKDAGWPVYGNGDVSASRWLAATSPADTPVAVYNQWDLVKSRDGLLLLEVFSEDRLRSVSPATAELDGSPYIYASDRPMTEATGTREYIDPRDTEFAADHIDPANKIYSSDGVQIYK